MERILLLVMGLVPMRLCRWRFRRLILGFMVGIFFKLGFLGDLGTDVDFWLDREDRMYL